MLLVGNPVMLLMRGELTKMTDCQMRSAYFSKVQDYRNLRVDIQGSY